MGVARESIAGSPPPIKMPPMTKMGQKPIVSSVCLFSHFSRTIVINNNTDDQGV